VAEEKRKFNLLTPLALMGVAWAIKKSAEKTQDVVAKKRPADRPKAKHEDLAWKVGLAVALASAEAIVSSLMSHTSKEEADQTNIEND